MSVLAARAMAAEPIPIVTSAATTARR